MTTLNTIIEEEEKKFLELFGERGNITNGERYTFKMGTTPQHILNHLTTAIQRAYEAGKADSAQENTPDTEWAVKAIIALLPKTEIVVDIGEGERDTVDLKEVLPYELNRIFTSLLSSRDTYWKERMRKEVKGMRKNPNKQAEWYGDDAGWEAQGWNQALDTLLDNLK